MMKGLLLGILISVFCIQNCQSQARLTIPSDAQQVLFLGNSITYAGKYIAFVETCYRLKNPDSAIEWINLGLPSETVSGLSEEGHANGEFPRPDLHERLVRVFESLDLDVVFFNYGMNDGIYLPFDMGRFQLYQDGINWLYGEIVTENAIPVALTPPVFDPNKGNDYSQVLDVYSDWLISKRGSDSWKVIDIHGPMKEYLAKERRKHADFFLAKDGVHPGDEGHWLMAREILEGLGWEKAAQSKSFEHLTKSFPQASELLELITKKQMIQRDALLKETKHLRPGLAEGLPMDEAVKKIQELEEEIMSLLNSNN